ncbi:MAG: asparagine synthase-related protein [Capsulimonadaceae bacterium]
MSAIFGILSRSGKPVDPAKLALMRDALCHRGPDGEGIEVATTAGLGHLMMWTTPESIGECLPFRSVGGNFTITSDARLDNRDELLKALGIFDDRVPDSRLILAAFERWGSDCPQRLLGDFAFAIWDRNSKTLFCATDHFGVKPLYYYCADDLFVFASEIKGLFAAGAPKSVNVDRVIDHILLVDRGREETYFEGIHCLLGATSLQVSASELSLRKYWELDLSREIKLSSDREYAETFRDLFREAVRCRMRSAYPAGSMLSGGLDSSSITCTARMLAPEATRIPWRTFSVVYPNGDPGCEAEYVDAVVGLHGLEPHRVDAGALDPMQDIETVIRYQDEPDVPGNLFVDWHLCKAAADSGVRVLLDGFDGDNVVSHGTGYFAELAAKRRWIDLAAELRGYGALKTDESWTQAYRAWYRRFGPKPIVKALALGERVANGLRTSLAKRSEGNAADLRPTLEMREILPPALQERYRSPRVEAFAATEREMHHRMITLPSLITVLHILERTAAARNVEMRFPFMDKRLVEFCLALPPTQKIRRGKTRWVLRTAMDGVIPPLVQWRAGKASLAEHLRTRMLQVCRARITETLQGPVSRLVEFVDIDKVRSCYRRLLDGTDGSNDLMIVWRTTCLGMWLRSL